MSSELNDRDESIAYRLMIGIRPIAPFTEERAPRLIGGGCGGK